MLSYEDSLVLKELGYPQELKEGDWFWRTDGGGLEYLCGGCWGSDRPPLDYYVRVPTTDGMIEGLGKDFGTLIYVQDWDAFGARAYKGDPIEVVVVTDQPNAEQALCELWNKVKSVPISE